MKVGDYVRTKSGSIFKIIGGNEDNWDLDISFGYLETFEENWLELYRYNDNHSFFNDKNIIKSSPNIIDLIEVGDYVNGSKVVDISIIGKDKEKWVWVEQMEDTDNKYGDDYVGYNNNQIKSIVTKEQFSQMEYRIGE